MKRQRCIYFSFFITLFLFFSTVSFASAPIDTTIAPMLQKVLPAIVNIRAQIKITDFNTLRELEKQRRLNNNNGSNNSNNNNEPEPAIPTTFVAVGSGVIVDAENGYIITNAHVVNDAQILTVTLSDSRHYTAKTIGIDKASDIAIIQIKAKTLTAAPLGDSNKVKVGDFVAAIGNPFGLGQTVTSGIASALGKTSLGIENYENFIQTDAPINQGNSGGALVNMHGEVIGINTAILAPNKGSIGIGFAIPANMAKSVMEQLLEFGDVKRGILGIGAQDLTPELATAFNVDTNQGAVVAYVLPDSPAAKSGIQVGDIVTSVNGVEVRNANGVMNTIGFLRVNSRTNIGVIRNNKPIVISVTLIDPKEHKQHIQEADPFLYGVGLKSFSALSPMYGNVQGVIVLGVDEDSSAWHSDLRPGDIITSINQQKVKSVDELKTVAAKADKLMLLNVLRGPGAIFLVINKEA